MVGLARHLSCLFRFIIRKIHKIVMATGKETPEEILATLADSTKCSPQLTEQVVKILLFPLQEIQTSNDDSIDIITSSTMKRKLTTSKASKAKSTTVSTSILELNIKSISTKLAPIAMRMVNQNLQCISGHIKSIQSTTSLAYHGKDQVLLCWVDTAFHAVSALQIMEPYLLIKSLDIDKALSNLITKLIELRMYKRALQELLNLRNRLFKAVQFSNSHVLENKSNQPAKFNSFILKTNTLKKVAKEAMMTSTSKNKNEHIKQAKATLIKNEASIGINTSRSSENEITTMYKELLLFPLSANVKDVSLVTLILACQMNSLRCLVEGDYSRYINFLPTWFNMKGNPCDWCKQLMIVDNKLGSKQIDILFRILNKAATTIETDCRPSVPALELKKVGLICLLETRPSDVAMICGLALRIGSPFCKWLADEKFYASVRAFYIDIMQRAESVLLDLKDFKYFIDLCGQFVYTAWKANDYKSAADTLERAKQLLECIPFVSECPDTMIVLQIATMKISLGSFALERATAERRVGGDYEKQLRGAMHNLNSIAMAFTEQPTPDLLTMMSKFLISIDTFRRATAALWENITQSVPEPSNGTENDEGFDWKRLLKLAGDVLDYGTSSIETLWVNSLPWFENLDQKPIIDLNRVSLIIVDSLSLLSQMFFNVDDFKTYENALNLLNRAEKFCRSLKSIDGLRWVSRAFYSIGAIIYSANEFKLALEPMSKTCELLSYYIDSNSKASDYSNEESVLLYNQLGKRLEVLGVCQQRVGMLEDARKSMERAISVLSPESILLFTKACNIKNITIAAQEHPLLPKLFDRYLKLVFLDLSLTELVLPHDFAHISKLDIADLGVIMEYELRVIKVLGNKADLSGIQMEIINRLLELYESKRHPIRRARILLEKVKLVRSTSSYIDKDSAFFNSLAEKAVESLKTEECGDDMRLAELRRYYLAMAYSWAGISKLEAGGLASKSFKMSLQLWKLVIGKISQYNSKSLSAPDIVEQTLSRIDDVEKFYGHLQLLADFFCVMDQPINQILSLRLMLKLNNGLRSSIEDCQTDSVYIYTSIGQIYMSLGYTGKAGVAFLQGKAIIENTLCTDEAKLQWTLGYSQYLCAIGNSEKSERIFGDAKRIAESCFGADTKTPTSKFRKRAQRNLLLADALFTCSEMSWRLGLLDKAITNALGSLRLLNRVVSSHNRRVKDQSEKSEMINPFVGENTNDDLFQNEKTCGFSTKFGIEFGFQLQQGDVIKRFVDCYRLLGNLYVIQGSVREAEYFLRQGLQLATIVRSATTSSRFLLSLTELEYRRYRLDESERNMQKALDIQEQVDVSAKDQAYVKKHIGDLNFRLAAYDPALESYQTAEMILNEITEESYIAGLERIDVGNDNTPREKQMVCLVPQTPISRITKDGVEFESFLLDSIKSEVLCRTGMVMGKQGNIAGSRRLLESNSVIGGPSLDAAEYYLTSAKVELLAIKDQLTLNSAFGMLSESVICLPAFKSTSDDKTLKKSKKAYIDNKLLRQAIDNVLGNLTEAYTHSFCNSTPHIFNETCLYLAYANMIMTQCMNHDRQDNRLSAAKCAHYLEMSKGLSLRREMLGSLTQKLRSKSKENADISWPTGPREEPIKPQSETEYDSDSEMEVEEIRQDNKLRKLRELYSEEGSLDAAKFQEQFVDILPPEWTVCSLTIDIEHDVMYIVRLRRFLPPLVLRLPLKRHSLRNGEEDGFGYQDAVAELDDILRLSNESTAAGKLYESREEKIGWWKNRKELDVRMKELLDLIDSNWFSGFKGAIVEDYKINFNAFQTFSSNIESLIFKVANSKSKRRATPMVIDAEVMKIFLSLGSSPKDEDVEDVIYFLLDAYQFNGVEIALDEINFDELIIKFKDALKDYHKATTQSDGESNGNRQHIILILDKSVQMLPWESLPILRGRTVSRLPCLSFLRDRILQLRNTRKRSNCKDNVHIVQRQKAFYILNPSKDLKNTQAEFEDYLARFDGWDGIIGRPPLEREFETALKNSDLFVYFGHSGGEQYIRGHHIRQFDKCAVALLMGCSSGALKPAGEFDPYGNALNYIMAGCPTLVANLWDVTDKDIDRFSKALFRNWGLEHNRKANTTPCSLVEAVARSRDECHLKYLIGSAPVVYGIPCYLE